MPAAKKNPLQLALVAPLANAFTPPSRRSADKTTPILRCVDGFLPLNQLRGRVEPSGSRKIQDAATIRRDRIHDRTQSLILQHIAEVGRLAGNRVLLEASRAIRG